MSVRVVIEIDGNRFDDFEGFAIEVSNQFFPNGEWEWRGNLDAFNDILRGGFGTPDDGFILRWINSVRSRAILGYNETIRLLERKVESCHPDNVPAVLAELEAARQGHGPTLFDILLEIIRSHGKGGDEAEDNVELQLA